MRIAFLLSLLTFGPMAFGQDSEPAPDGEEATTEDAASEESPTVEAADDEDTDDDIEMEGGQAEALSPQQEDPRTIAVISNLDFGLGKDAKGRWLATEDFRWTRALATYLDALMDREEPVDLVIAGGLLNLWEAPESLSCSGPDCQGDQVVKVAESIVAAHGQDFALLGRFSRANDNRLYVIPGARDGGLSDPKVWSVVQEALMADVDDEALAALQPPPPPEPEPEEGEEEDLLDDEAEDEAEVVEEPVVEDEEPPREYGEAQVFVVGEGYWSSVNGQVVINPGHDFGPDARFLQRVLNANESDLPLVDNLRPFALGALLTMNEAPSNPKDVAQFMSDYSVLMSPARRSRKLRDQGSDNAPEWNIKKARKRGHLLFTDSMHPDWEVRDQILNGQGESWLALRESLAGAAQDLSVSQVDAVCDQVAIHKEVYPSQGVYPRCDLGRDDTTQISGGKGAWFGDKVRAMHPREETMSVFIYGGTNEPEAAWELARDRRARDTYFVYNAGSFQRAADPRMHRAMTGKLLGKSDNDVTGRELVATLGKLDLRHFPACYTTVIVEFDESLPSADLKHWYLPEKAQEGAFTVACDRRCGWAAEMCR